MRDEFDFDHIQSVEFCVTSPSVATLTSIISFRSISQCKTRLSKS